MNWTDFDLQVIRAVMPIIFAGLGYLGHWLSKLIRAKAHNAAADMAMDILENFVGTAVIKLEQTVAAEIRARGESGRLGPQDAKAIKEKAIATVKAYYGPEGLDLLAKSLKMARDAVPALIADKIETKVYNMKYPNQVGLPVFRAGPPTPPSGK